MEYVFYYKVNRKPYSLDGEKVPIMSGSTSSLSLLVPMRDEEKRKIQKDFPQTIGNLFIHINGTEFNLDQTPGKQTELPCKDTGKWLFEKSTIENLIKLGFDDDQFSTIKTFVEKITLG